MGGLFGGKSREVQGTQMAQGAAANQYDGMVTKALERLTRWAFPDSQVERVNSVTWQLWHTRENGEKYIDVLVELLFKKDQPHMFMCSKTLHPETAGLNREDLDEALRRAICSVSG
jgi:hypothetical protein